MERLILLPIVAKSLFIKDFALFDQPKYVQDYCYNKQCECIYMIKLIEKLIETDNGNK